LGKILAAQPDNPAAFLEPGRVAAKRGDEQTLHSAVAHLNPHAATWPPEVQQQWIVLQTAVAGPDPRAAAFRIAFLRAEDCRTKGTAFSRWGVTRCSYKDKTDVLCLEHWWRTRLPVLLHPLRRLPIAISLFLGKKLHQFFPGETHTGEWLQASILTNPVSPVPSVMITVYRLAMSDPSLRDVRPPFQLRILGPLRLHLCPA